MLCTVDIHIRVYLQCMLTFCSEASAAEAIDRLVSLIHPVTIESAAKVCDAHLSNMAKHNRKNMYICML